MKIEYFIILGLIYQVTGALITGLLHNRGYFEKHKYEVNLDHLAFIIIQIWPLFILLGILGALYAFVINGYRKQNLINIRR